MLVHTRQELSRRDIIMSMEEIYRICDLCYYGTYFELREKINAKELKNGRDGFDQFWLQHKPKANASVLLAEYKLYTGIGFRLVLKPELIETISSVLHLIRIYLLSQLKVCAIIT